MKSFFLAILLFIYGNLLSIPHYYATCADAKFFKNVVHLIKTIMQNDSAYLEQIAVFDLGFEVEQRQYLANLPKVKIYELEKKHPDLLKYFKTSSDGRYVRGWFAWKPVALKQALDLFPYILYLDSAMEVLQPLDDLFLHIAQNGYFLIDSGDPVEQSLPYRITQIVQERIVGKLPQSYQAMLSSSDIRIISAGIQGLSRKYYDCYLMPVYNYVSEIELFSDDKTAKLGFGAGRHDQILFSIYAALNGMWVNRAGWQNITVGGVRQPLHCHWNRKELNQYSSIKY